jgi:hypothetical protein
LLGQIMEIRMQMIEKVARAVAASQGSSDWRLSLVAARSAVGALRNPTPEMLDAACAGLPDWGYLLEDWHAMINYVLCEPITITTRFEEIQHHPS